MSALLIWLSGDAGSVVEMFFVFEQPARIHIKTTQAYSRLYSGAFNLLNIKSDFSPIGHIFNLLSYRSTERDQFKKIGFAKVIFFV